MMWLARHELLLILLAARYNQKTRGCALSFSG
jgi:hypothetical protein